MRGQGSNPPLGLIAQRPDIAVVVNHNLSDRARSALTLTLIAESLKGDDEHSQSKPARKDSTRNNQSKQGYYVHLPGAFGREGFLDRNTANNRRTRTRLAQTRVNRRWRGAIIRVPPLPLVIYFCATTDPPCEGRSTGDDHSQASRPT